MGASLMSARDALAVFDLDGTLAESKAAVDPEMAGLLGGLLQLVDVAIISGGNWPQFQKQVVSNLPPNAKLRALSLLPNCGTKFYRYEGDWDLLYSEDFGADERDKIVAALKSVVQSPGFACNAAAPLLHGLHSPASPTQKPNP
jgi:phosphomannomutase